jgi:hypothetical protein
MLTIAAVPTLSRSAPTSPHHRHFAQQAGTHRHDVTPADGLPREALQPGPRDTMTSGEPARTVYTRTSTIFSKNSVHILLCFAPHEQRDVIGHSVELVCFYLVLPITLTRD